MQLGLSQSELEKRVSALKTRETKATLLDCAEIVRFETVLCSRVAVIAYGPFQKWELQPRAAFQVGLYVRDEYAIIRQPFRHSRKQAIEDVVGQME
jgi:hypothetical protein